MINKIIVIGGGYLGLMAGIALAKLGIEVDLIMYNNFQSLIKEMTPSRLFAVADGSQQLIEEHLGLTIQNLGQTINHIRVYEHSTSAFIDFNPQNLNIDNFGLMVEENKLYQELCKLALQFNNLNIYENCRIESILNDEDYAEVNLENSQKFKGDLTLICDGKNSAIRSLLGIEAFHKDYGQSGIICDISHQANHEGMAVENFTPQGPFAILPKKGGYESSIVWTLKQDLALLAMNLPKDEQLSLIKDRFGNYLGNIELKSELKSFPFSLNYSRDYFKGRFFLLGDALHSIHPLAGQGLNLSIRDLDFVVKTIKDSIDLGLDVGISSKLNKYTKERFCDNQILIESTNLLNAVFSNDLKMLQCFRSFGLNIVNQAPWLKHYIMLYASGLLKI